MRVVEGAGIGFLHRRRDLGFRSCFRKWSDMDAACETMPLIRQFLDYFGVLFGHVGSLTAIIGQVIQFPCDALRPGHCR